MRSRLGAFTLVDLLAGCTVSVLLLCIGIPTAVRVRELSKRSVCGINLAGIGAAAKVYADANNGLWPVPAFKNGAINAQGIMYVRAENGFAGPGSGQTGYNRFFASISDVNSPGQNVGSTEVAVTRAYWMLVRSGSVTVPQFICPSSSRDLPDPTNQIDLYYDFFHINHISYGYQVPFGPSDTRPRHGMDHRQIIAADKGPWYLDPGSVVQWTGPNGDLQLHDPPKSWRRFNSANHGGIGNGEGQNALFGDGHATFARIPAIGIDNDNIYTHMSPQWGILPYNRIHGETPHLASPPPFPGQDVFGVRRHATTDSLIYP